MKRFFDKVAQHLDKLDAESVRGQYKGLADEFAFLEAVLRTMGEGVLVVSEQGELAYANPAAEKLAYLDFASSKGKPIAKVLPGWDWSDLLAPAAETDWTRAAAREIELTYPEHRILELRAMPNGTATVVLLRDVTLAHAREKDALESSRIEAIQQLASGVAHEIGNPLNAIALNLQLLKRDPTDTETIDVCMNQVKRLDGIARMAKLETLDASGLGLEDVSALAGCKNLRAADLRGNGLTLDAELSLAEALPECRFEWEVPLASGLADAEDGEARMTLAEFRQGAMKVIHVNEMIAEIFDVTGFADILTIE